MSLKRLTQTTVLCAAILSASCSSSGGGNNGGGDTVSKTGSVLADGYLAFATVCLDTTGDKSCADEDTSVKTDTDSSGSFTLSALLEQYAEYTLVAEAEAGTAKEDGNEITSDLVLSSPAGETDVISPLTTLVEAYLEANSTLSSDEAEDSILEDLEVTDESVSIFDDYIAQLTALSSGKPLGAIAVGAQDNSGKSADYTLLRQVSQVASLSIQDNIRIIREAETAGTTSLRIDNDFRSVFAVIGNDIIEQVADIASQARAAGASFTPANLVRLLDIADVEVAVIEQDATANASTANIENILRDGASFFGFEDAVSGSDSFPFMEQQTFTLVPAATAGVEKKKKTTSRYTLGEVQGQGQFDPLDSNNNGSVPSNGTWETRRSIDITFNADGSAIVNTLGRSLNQRAITTDISGLNLQSFVSPGMKAFVSGTFSQGAQAIRPTFTFLNDYYVIRPDKEVAFQTFLRLSNGTISDNTTTQTELEGILNPEPFVFATQIPLNDNGADFTDDASPRAVFFDNINPSIKYAVELIGDRGVNQQQGQAEFYEYNFADRTSSDYHRITHISTGTWQRKTISLGNDATGNEQFTEVIVTEVPAIIRQKVHSPEFEKVKRFIAFTLFDNGSGAGNRVRRGRFVPEGTVTTKRNWRFNSVATADIINSIGSLTDFFPVTDLSTLQKGDAFNLRLFEFTNANTTPTDYGSQPFIRADDLDTADLVGNFAITTSLLRNFINRLTFNVDGTGTIFFDPNDGGSSALTGLSTTTGQLSFTEDDGAGSSYTWTLTPIVPSRYGDNAILELNSTGDLIAGDSGFEDITIPVKIKALPLSE